MPNVDAVELEVMIAARPETVFRYFTDPVRFQKWMGPHSELHAREGGELVVRFPHDASPAMGTVREVIADRRIVFTWGYEAGTHGMAPGSSTVTVELDAVPEGTRLVLRHTGLPSADLGREHLGGWRHYFGVVAAKAAAEVVGVQVERRVDQFIMAWNEGDGTRRRELLAGCFEEDGLYRDAYGYVPGAEGLDLFMANAKRFMPGMTLSRLGPVWHSHGQLCFQWSQSGPDGRMMASGMTTGTCSPSGKIRTLTAFWGQGE